MLDTMCAHVESCLPLEACGLLAGKENFVRQVLTVTNQAKSPVRFRMDPFEQIQAFEWMESNGLDLIGIFHSHPEGPETVSVADIAEAAYDVVYIIWSRQNGIWKARGFWFENGRASEVELVSSTGSSSG
jgi:proteasome lid subunit RPN8/RPN11